jgi:hypothetical protein
MRNVLRVLSWILAGTGCSMLALTSIPQVRSHVFPRPPGAFAVKDLWPQAIWTAYVPLGMILVGCAMILVEQRLRHGEKKKGKER